MVWLDQIKETVGLKKEEKPRFVWTAYLDSQMVALALTKHQGKETELLEVKTQTIDKTEDLIGLIEVMKGLIRKISFPQKPKEIFFGVPDFWFQDGQLKDPHQKALEKLSQGSGLAFLGSISVFKAIIGYYRQKEGNSPNLIFLEILPQKIRVVLCRQGRVESRREREKGDSVAVSLQEALKKEFTGEGLPARIVVLGAEDFEKVRGEILDSSFEETGLFLHLPKVESLSSKELLAAVSSSTKGVLEEKKGLVLLGEEADEEKKDKEKAEESKDEKTEETKKEKEEEVEEEKTEPMTAERFGFVVDEDISQQPDQAKVLPTKKVFLSPPSPAEKVKVSLGPIFKKILARVRKLSVVFSRLDFSRLPRSGFLIGGTVVLVLVGLFLAYWFLPRAKIVLFVEPKDFKEALEVTITPADFEASKSARVLQGKLVSVDFSGERSAPATGTKLTGTKAIGQVTVFNKTTGVKSFPQGTEVVGPNGLVFTLDQAVSLDPATVATSSGGETKTYGRAEVGVTAADIGSEYNLPGGIDFSIDGFSTDSYSAKSPEGFAEGSSQEVTVVSEEDQAGLEEGLSEEFKQKAGAKVAGEAGEALKVFPEAVNLEIKERRFSREIGEEGETVSLSMEVNAQTLGFSSDSLKELLAAEVAESVPDEFELIPGQIESQEEFLREFGEAVVIKVNFEAHLLPKLDLGEIKKKIAGKKPTAAQDYLTGLPRTNGAQITLWPPLPSFLWHLPRQTERMSIEIKPE